ncbi:MAG: thiazole biosynthesis protein, partial [bacterium]
HYLFFNLGGRAHEIGVKEVAHYLWDKYHRSHPATFVTVPFEKVVAEILMKIDNAYMGVVLKRMMVRAAQRVASKLGIKALVTGESVAQVSSQTLTNLSVIDAVSETLVMRPLVTMDKPDIIAIAREIGTEEFAANMPEYCGVISVKPTTSARADKVALLESEFPMQVLDQALSEATFQTVSDVLEQMPPAVNVEVFAIPQPGAVLLDIRHPDEAERKPLAVPGASVESLPFYRLQSAFADLPRDRQYLLYCDKGVMSRLHAELLMEEGCANVGVYRPAG